MNKLWLGFAAIAAYGSIYPFDFQFHHIDPAAWQAFVETCCHETNRGDILGNVVLFLPFGYLGILAAGEGVRVSRQFVLVCVIGVVFALALQVAQFYLPSRDENLQDVIWNLLGIAIGAGLGIPSRRYVQRAVDQAANLQLVPWILIGSWLTYRLLPFVPSIDFQSIKDSLKPLREIDDLSLAGTAYYATAWLVVAYLLDHAQKGARLGRFLPILVLGSFALEVLIVYNVLTPTSVAGGLLAIPLYWLIFSRLRRVEVPLLASFLVALAWSDLTPFILRAEPAAFNWLPFQGFLGGSMFINAQSASEKVFTYSSIVYLLLRIGAGGWLSLLAATAWIAAIEFAQTYFGGHTPEITDPLLVVLAALAINAIQREDRTRDSGATAGWITHRINLNTSQSDLLDQLARELGVTVHEANRKIIDAVVHEAGQFSRGAEKPVRELTAMLLKQGPAVVQSDRPGSNERSGRWVVRDLALHPEQNRLLVGLAQDSGVSVSRMARTFVDHFFRSLAIQEN